MLIKLKKIKNTKINLKNKKIIGLKNRNISKRYNI